MSADLRRRVVVTGMGATTPLGGDVPSTWRAVLAGESGVRLLDEEWAEGLPVRIAAPVAVDPLTVLERVKARTLDRTAQLALIAAHEAWTDAGTPEVDGDRLAAAVASGIGGVLTLMNQYDVLREKGPRRVSPHTVPMLMPNSSAAYISLEFGARARSHTPTSACASGVEAIALAADLIRLDRADMVICGGTEACLHPLPMAAFASMRALSPREDDPQAASRPYDKGRDGFVMGEGAGILVVESEEHALRRGARIYGEVAGIGLTADAHHITAPDPVGRGASRAIELALADAGITPEDVVHINAHATSTPVGDVAEAAAIRKALGDAARKPVVSATKGNMGHLIGAAGAVESILTLLALRERTAPAIRNLDDPDDEVQLTLARIDNVELPEGGVGLNNSFGFGGHNASLVLRAAAS